MSYMLPHLHDGWEVDQTILQENNKVIIIRFGYDGHRSCMQMDEMLYQIAYSIQNFASIFLVDIEQVTDFNNMYELFDPFAVMFFFRNKHILVDFGTGNNNKLNFLINNKQELIDIVENVYRAATKGRGLAESPIDYSTKHKY